MLIIFTTLYIHFDLMKPLWLNVTKALNSS